METSDTPPLALVSMLLFFDDVKREEWGIFVTLREDIPAQSCFPIEYSKHMLYMVTWFFFQSSYSHDENPFSFFSINL